MRVHYCLALILSVIQLAVVVQCQDDNCTLFMASGSGGDELQTVILCASSSVALPTVSTIIPSQENIASSSIPMQSSLFIRDISSSSAIALSSMHVVATSSHDISLSIEPSLSLSPSSSLPSLDVSLTNTALSSLPSFSTMGTFFSSTHELTSTLTRISTTEETTPSPGSVSLSQTNFFAIFTTTQSASASSLFITPSLATSQVTYTILSTFTSSSTQMSTSVTPTVTPTATPSTSVWDEIIGLFQNTAIVIVVAIGGTVILILILVITIICCCCCCCKRKRDRFSVDQHRSSNGGVVGMRYRPSISAPQSSYHHELKQVKEERQRLEVFAETELGDVNIDDALHYQGHSQVQHSQLFNGNEGGQEISVTQQSLAKLTPLNPSQILLQVGEGISVDDDIDEPPPIQEENSQRDARDNGGGDSPFMHLSDNLPPSRVRSLNRLSDQPVDQPESSQYSYLGLGVMHGADVVFTNTNSIMDEASSVADIGLVGISNPLLNDRSADTQRTNRHTASPPSNDASLDDTPTKEPSKSGARLSDTRDIALLTSLDSNEPPVREKRSATMQSEPTHHRKPKRMLSAMTSLNGPPTSPNDQGEATPTTDSDLQDTPERQRSHTLATPEGSFRRATTTKSSRLGKLTSLEYIRASLRMKLNKIKAAKESSPETNKKPLKSALRKTGSTASYDSNSSNTYVNHHTHEYDDSPHHIPVLSPRHAPYPEYMGGYPPYHAAAETEYMPPTHYDPVGMRLGYAPPPIPMDPYSYPVSPQHMGMAAAGPVYTDQLSPILSVSQLDYHPSMHVGLLPQYGHPGLAGVYEMPGETYYPSQPPGYDDDDEDDDIPYRQTDMNVSASQRNVTWNLQHQEIPPTVELTPSDDEDDER